jgi:hypothetical protein
MWGCNGYGNALCISYLTWRHSYSIKKNWSGLVKSYLPEGYQLALLKESNSNGSAKINLENIVGSGWR